ncbi:sensor histidine kinase [Chryseobacterium viscerum]|uniref:Histidine kinase n=1 Tax=Chryseobacterium viscerum TaxID=1037377 RepID=A0A316WHY1_9FLAO|nr:histidine kinase [Chryseobacterium viscerum]KAB1232829.1 histidine kinase [Chryseobacterium viscerum]PWN61004.1 histidine kinase [Chryseobacterium viscerum]
MIYAKYINTNGRKVFRIDPRIILFSSLFMGILASVPKILRIHITLGELMIDFSISFLFSLFVWYFNIYSLPKFSIQNISTRFFNKKLVISLSIGIVVMAAIVLIHHIIFPKYGFNTMVLMYEFRGILINLTIYMFLYLLYQTYNSQQIKFELEQIRTDNLHAQYELLKQQINPHFLFNSLNTLKSMIDIKDDNSGDFVVRLADFYRFTLDNRKLDLIPLKKELAILDAYIFLLTSRFEDGIEFKIDIQEEILNSYIPPFTLQLLCENCIKHNIVSMAHPLIIKLYSDEGYIVIENNFQPKNIPQDSAGIGIENIRERYKHFAEKELTILQNDINFTVKLPIVDESFSNRR